MKQFFLLTGFLVFAPFSAQVWGTEDQYIQSFAQYAVEEMEKYKIPASITLAQGLLETGGGQSRLAREGNNHFGIKCKEGWTGRTMSHTDDAPNECFRVYDSPRESYEDHSKFLAYRKYYQNLFTLNPTDYKAWAHGLKKAGYATNPRYAQILISKIEKYKLYEFDRVKSSEVRYAMAKLYPQSTGNDDFIVSTMPKPIKSVAPTSQTSIRPYQEAIKPTQSALKTEKPSRNMLATILVKEHPNRQKKYIIVPSETTVDYISNKFGIRKARLVKYNELTSENLAKNQIIFLENKANSGSVNSYKSKGETMHQIAQKFAIRLKKLYAKNNMNFGSQPKTGQIIKLK